MRFLALLVVALMAAPVAAQTTIGLSSGLVIVPNVSPAAAVPFDLTATYTFPGGSHPFTLLLDDVMFNANQSLELTATNAAAHGVDWAGFVEDFILHRPSTYPDTHAGPSVSLTGPQGTFEAQSCCGEWAFYDPPNSVPTNLDFHVGSIHTTDDGAAVIYSVRILGVPAPEPSTLALLLFGLPFAVVRRRGSHRSTLRRS